MNILLGVLGVLVVLAAVGTGVSLWMVLRAGSVPMLERTVSAMRLELADVVDRLEQWQKRDRVRRLREGKEDAEHAAPAPQTLSRQDRLAHLRAMRRNNGSA